MLKLRKDSNNDIVFVPPNCTDMLQPLDLSVNKSAKDYLKSRFQQWYSDQIFEQHNDSTSLHTACKIPYASDEAARGPVDD